MTRGDSRLSCCHRLLHAVGSNALEVVLNINWTCRGDSVNVMLADVTIVV